LPATGFGLNDTDAPGGTPLAWRMLVVPSGSTATVAEVDCPASTVPLAGWMPWMRATAEGVATTAAVPMTSRMAVAALADRARRLLGERDGRSTS
jgi:hypothetical protein